MTQLQRNDGGAPSREPYNYRLVDDQAQDIRLLRLQPGSWEQEPRCALFRASLRDNPSYETLSYVWGTEPATHQIHMDGVEVLIRDNLKSALRHLRRPLEPLVIWIDALCINQEDLQEKSLQVAMMGEVYRRCSQVNIWLGCEEQCCSPQTLGDGEQIDDPFAVFRCLTKDLHLDKIPFFSNASDPCLVRMRTGWERVSASLWWTRLWTVQECVLPQEAILRYSDWNYSFEDLLTASALWFKHLEGCCRRARDLDQSQCFSFTMRAEDLSPLEETRKALLYNKPPLLVSLISEYSTRRCSDPRDKIYGFLSLVDSQMSQALVPDYSLTVEEVFTMTTRVALTVDGGLDGLIGSMFGVRDSGLPSWVRDFVKESRVHDEHHEDWTRLKHSELYSAAAGLPKHSMYKVVDTNHLRLRGVLASRIRTSTTGIPYAPYLFAPELLKATQQNLLPNSPLENEEHRIFRFWKTALAGIISTSRGSERITRRITDEDLHLSLQWDALLCKDVAEEEVEFDIRSTWISTWGRSFFVSEAGKLGLCYSTARPGDEIWVLCGGRMPFVLRPCQKDSPGNAQRYYFIGDCYLEGYMDGEAAKEKGHLLQDVILI